MAIIEIEALTKDFGATRALDGLSFTVEEGRVCGFLGPNGAGKTTTFRILLGLVDATSGVARIDGQTYRQIDNPIRVVGALLEASGFHPGRTARSHLRYLTTVAGLPAQRADEMLELVGLTAAASRRIRTFSLGMRQRLALATALVGDPQVLILDEPANGLDPAGMRWLRDFLREQASGGRTVVISSHVLAEVAQSVDDIVIISQGKLVRQSAMAALSGGDSAVRVRTSQAGALRKLLKSNGMDAKLGRAGELLVKGGTTDAIGTLAAENAIPVFELITEGDDLEDIYVSLTGASREATQ